MNSTTYRFIVKTANSSTITTITAKDGDYIIHVRVGKDSQIVKASELGVTEALSVAITNCIAETNKDFNSHLSKIALNISAGSNIQ